LSKLESADGLGLTCPLLVATVAPESLTVFTVHQQQWARDRCEVIIDVALLILCSQRPARFVALIFVLPGIIACMMRVNQQAPFQSSWPIKKKCDDLPRQARDTLT
jgi:hypothetical protein